MAKVQLVFDFFLLDAIRESTPLANIAPRHHCKAIVHSYRPNMADVPIPPPGGDGAPEAPAVKKLTAKELRVLEREAKDKEAAAAMLSKNASVFGELPMIQSRSISGKKWTRVSDLGVGAVGSTVLLRARVQLTRDTGKVLFLSLRQGISTMQAVIFKATNADFLKWASKINRESVVDVTGEIHAPEKRVESVTQGDVELQISTMFIVSRAAAVLPFQLEDASRSERVIEERQAEIAKAEAGASTSICRSQIITRRRCSHRLGNRSAWCAFLVACIIPIAALS